MQVQTVYPSEQQNAFVFPTDWYNKMKVDVMATPVILPDSQKTIEELEANDPNWWYPEKVHERYMASLTPEEQQEVIRRSEELDEILKDAHVDMSNFKFDRDEANNYN
jgi:hypothetical protein